MSFLAGVPGSVPLGALLQQIWISGLQTFLDFVSQELFAWVTALNFLYVTPASLTYQLLPLKNACSWVLGLMNGLLALLLVVGGYNVATRHFFGSSAISALDFFSQLAWT